MSVRGSWVGPLVFIYLFIYLVPVVNRSIHYMGLPTEDSPRKYRYLFPLGSFNRINIHINNFQKIDFYRKENRESCFLTIMRVRNKILASKMVRQADFAPHIGPDRAYINSLCIFSVFL